MLEPKLIKFQKHQKDDFRKSFALSLALHSAILSLFLIKFVFFSEPLVDFSQAISVSLADFSYHQPLPETLEAPPVDDKLDNKLPPKITETFTEAPPEPIDVAPEIIKNEPKKELKPDQLEAKNVKARQKAALNKLKKNSAIEKIKQDLKNDSIAQIKNQIKAQMKKTSTSGSSTRVLAAGSVLIGLDRLQASSYLEVIDQNIKKFWSLPQWLINKPYKAQLLVKFSRQGQILSLKIISSSGNSSYDQYCMQAVEKAAPFPSVPDKLTEKFSVDGVVIGFPE